MDKDRIEKNPKLYAPLVLAYIGDAVYEVYVRDRLVSMYPNMPVHRLHREAIKYVKAHAQSESINSIMDCLNEEELAVYKRGRNAKSPTVPKNADVGEYRKATGFEALMGYLSLSNENDRMEMLMKLSFEHILQNELNRG